MAKDSIFSLRVTSGEAAQWRAFAGRTRLSVSELLRAAMNRLVTPADGLDQITTPAKPAGWHCAHATITAPPGVLSNITIGCGCEMQPIY